MFVAFVTGEAVRLAKDFEFLCNTEFPARQAAEYVTRHRAIHSANDSDLSHRRQTILATK